MTTQYEASYQPVGDGQGMGLSSGDYTWAKKPDANSVPVGTLITIRDFCYSDWYSDGTYWRPRGGRCVLVHADLRTYTTTSTTEAQIPISTTDLPVIPFNDLMVITKSRFFARLMAYRQSPVSGTVALSARHPTSGMVLCREISNMGTNNPVAADGSPNYWDGSSYLPALWNVPGNFVGSPANAPPIAIPSSPSQPGIYAQVGGAGETMQLIYFTLEFAA